MSKYKVGDVAALFSEPKEPTTEAGKKLQSLFKEFHSTNKSEFQSRKLESKWNDKPKEKSGDQSIFKKNKKRKFSDIADSELSLNDQSNFKKVKHEQEVEFKNGKQKNNFKERAFLQKKKIRKSSLHISDSFIKSEKNEHAENEIQSTGISISNNSPKIKKKSFIKKSKCQSNNDSQDESFKEEIKEFIKNSSKISKKKNIEKCNSIKRSEVENSFFDKNSPNKHESKENSNIKNSTKDRKQVSNFTKMPKKQKKSKNNSFEIGDSEKSEVSDKIYNNDISFKSKNKPYVQNMYESKASSSSPKDKDKNQVSDFIRRPKKQKKKFKNSFEATKTPNKVFNNEDTLFKSENDEYVRSNAKKFEREISKREKSVFKSSKNGSIKKKPDFVKLLDAEDDGQLNRTLFIGNLPLNTRINDLKHLFSPFGEIESIRFRGVETNKAKIFSENPPKSLNANYAADSAPGFVIFKERESAENALTLCGTVFKNHHITVNFAMPTGTKKLYDEKRSIFIGNLPFAVEDESVWNTFSDCGKIEGVRIIRDKETGIGKGVGYVLFSTVKSKEAALSLDNLMIDGRLIRIKTTDSNKKTQKSDTTVIKRDTFKSRAIRLKKENKNVNSRKSVTKLVKKQKSIHKKKKIASLLQKSMK